MSLRFRIVALIGATLLISMVLGAFVAGYQAKQALRAELDAGLSGAAQTVNSAFEDLPRSDHPDRDLRQLVATFNGNRHVVATLITRDGARAASSQTRAPPTRAPTWFRRLLGSSPKTIVVHVPESIRGYAAIGLSPTAAIDVGDAWAEFAGFILVVCSAAIAGLLLVYLVIGAAFRPLRALSREFMRIGTGDYSGRVLEKGPAELLKLQQGFNIMVGQLAGTTDRNRLLTNQLLTIQDEERADIARDLHDDIGPYLFAVNMDAQMIAQLNAAGGSAAIADQVLSIQTAVGHMQRQVRDLLGRLRPAPATEFGLNAAIQDLVRFWAARRPDIAFQVDLINDGALCSEVLKDVAFRVVQEAANNAVRHADPTAVQISIELQNECDLVVMVFDDGAGAPESLKAGGLGLVGMRERVTALGGSVVYGPTPSGRGWTVAARLPLAVAPQNATSARS